jgi:hypothetical protein
MEQNLTEVESIAQSFVPTFSDDSKKANYLSYLIANFAHREACQLTPVSEKQVRRWKDADENFEKLCTSGLTELRKQFANQFIDMQFTRNFHLVLQKDFRVLYKDALGGKLDENENKYLEKIRQHYTPQSLAMVKQLLGGGTVEQPFDFTRLTLSIKREQIDIVQEKGNTTNKLLEG